MKLYQTIVIFDVVVAGTDEADARETLEKWVHGFGGTEEVLKPSESIAREIREAKQIRSAMLDAKPIVGLHLTDEEFEQVKGCTNNELFRKLYTKDPSKR